MSQLKNQKKLNGELSAAPEKAEKQLQIHLKEWQNERSILQKATEELEQTLKVKQQKRSEEEREMGSRLDKLGSRKVEKQARKKRTAGWPSSSPALIRT